VDSLIGCTTCGRVLNNGTLTLDQISAINNTMALDAGDFRQGLGGIRSFFNTTTSTVHSSVIDLAWCCDIFVGGAATLLCSTIVVIHAYFKPLGSGHR
jgi:hypothetical protein